MKKILAIILAAVILASFTACVDSEDENNGDVTTVQSTNDNTDVTTGSSDEIELPKIDF